MKIKGWLVTALVILGVVFIYRGCLNQKAPDEELADHFEALCDIARDGAEAPEKGVRKLGRYLGKNLDDIFGSFGGMIATIERVEDDAKHDERARLARSRLAAPLRGCERDWDRFERAIENDPAALELVMHAMERLNRTIDILLSSTSRLDWKRLPSQLVTLFDQKLC